MPFACALISCRQRAGFNLVEAAIVLGVVGLVLGGIWIAAAAVGNANKLAQTQSGLIVLYNTLRQRYPFDLVGAQGYFTPSLAQLQTLPLPAGFALDTVASAVRDPFANPRNVNDGGVALTINNDLWGTTTARLLVLTMTNNLNADGSTRDSYKCQNIVPRLTGIFKSGGDLEYVFFCTTTACSARTTYSSSSFPVSPTSADCQSPRFGFGFRN